ncbi:cytochrome d ubiquinol oxidase subunit II [Streptosporangium oxazolinicum]|uniref:Cytochrome d ubiquinol oxidase subunit II n=1 Tax=Streptosporangium oxazolinicum TaxID=909287 RepID=A0ABP8AWF1_9ACTN
MDVVWLLILGSLLVGYFVLEGIVLGAGLLLGRYGTRDDTQDDTDVSVAAFAPFALANEVWLVAVAGVLMGAFPLMEGEVISGLYPFVVTGLVGWVVRDAGLWFRLRRTGRAWRRLWARAIVTGSGLLAVAWGFVIGNLLLGLPESPPSAGRLFTPYAALWAVTLPALFAAHGAAFMARRLPGRLRPGVRRLGDRVTGIALALTAVATGGGLAVALVTRGLGDALATLPLFGAVVALWRVRSRPFGEDGRSLALSAVAVGAPAVVAGLVAAPGLMAHPASGPALAVLTAYGLGALVLVLVVQVWAWRLFDRRVERDAPSFF